MILAGLYQFTPLKQACLRNCRSPFAFVLNHWRDGWPGALLCVVSVMNLLWVAGIAVLVFAGKLLPGGIWIGRLGGGAMPGFGVLLLMHG